MSYVVYIDDSGTKEYNNDRLYSNNGNTPLFVFGALLMTTDASDKLTTEVRKLKSQAFGTEEVEIKSTWLRLPKHREEQYLKKFRMSSDTLDKFTTDFYQIITTTDLTLLGVIIDKLAMQNKYPKPYYPAAIAYEILMQRVVQQCTTQESVSVIIDDMNGATPAGNQHKTNLQKQHEKLRKTGSSLMPKLNFSPLTQHIKFKDSQKSHQLQVADIIAYNTFRQFRDHGTDWEIISDTLPMYKWFKLIAHKFRTDANGKVQGWGIIKYPLDNRIAWKQTKQS